MHLFATMRSNASQPYCTNTDDPSDSNFAASVGFFIVFCTIEALVLAGLYAFARSGLVTNGFAIVGLLPIAVAVMAVAVIPLRVPAWQGQAPLLSALVVTTTLLLPIVGGVIGLWIMLPLCAVALVGLRMAVACARQKIFAHPWTLILGAPTFALIRFIAINGGQLTHVYSPEFALLGQSYLDTSFHSALAGMLRNFGVVSTGLDGLVPQFTHVGSHLWLGYVASMFNIPTIDLYPMAFQIFAAPCFTFFFLFASTYLQRTSLRQPVIMIIAALLVTFVSSWFFLDKLLLSESYVFGLIIFLCAIPLLFELSSSKNVSKPAFWYCLVASACLGIIMFVFKVPVGLIWAAAVTSVVARRFTAPRWSMTIVVLLVLTMLGSALILGAVGFLSLHNLRDIVRPFDFGGGSQKYVLSDLIFIILTAVLIAYSNFNGSYKRGEVAGLLGLLAVLGALPGALLAIENTAYYFVNVVAWLALVLAAGQLAVLLQSSAERHRWVGIGAIALLVVVVGADPDRYKRFSIFLERVAVLQELGRDGQVAEWPRKRVLLQSLARISELGVPIAARAAKFEPLFGADVSAALDRTPGTIFVRQIREAQATTSAKMVVFVPPENVTFWTMSKDCRAQSFFIPAMVGVPMIMGLYPQGNGLHCELGITYGFGYYGPESHSMSLDTKTICERVRARDFEEVLILGSPDDAVKNRVVSCLQ